VWSVGSDPVHVYLGTRRVMVDSTAGLQSQAVHGIDEAYAALRIQLQSLRKRSRLRLWLSGSLCRPFILNALPGVIARREVHRIALAMAEQGTGLQSPCRLWIEPRPVSDDRVVVAMQAGNYEELSNTLRDAGHKAVSVRPWWAELLRDTSAKTQDTPTCLSVQDCDSVTLLLGAGVEMTMATTYAPVLDNGTAKSIVARTLISSGVADSQLRFLRLTQDLQLTENESARPTASSAPIRWAEVVA